MRNRFTESSVGAWASVALVTVFSIALAMFYIVDAPFATADASKASASQAARSVASRSIAEPKTEQELKAIIEKALPRIKLDSIRPSTVPGYYEVFAGNGQALYISQDGRHFFAGDLFRLDGYQLSNATEDVRKTKRVDLLNDIPEKEMFVFAPKETKAVITVFTDIDCFYCRKLHNEMAELNQYGIQVNYLAFPRAGVGSKAYEKAVSAWCSDDRKKALTAAKNGEDIEEKRCDNPIEQQYLLGRSIGVRGTPAIYLESGEEISGYMPAKQLAKGLGLL